jgi:hypothetical protein
LLSNSTCPATSRGGRKRSDQARAFRSLNPKPTSNTAFRARIVTPGNFVLTQRFVYISKTSSKGLNSPSPNPLAKKCSKRKLITRVVSSRPDHQPRGSGVGVGDERSEPELLDGDAKLRQLGLVHADQVVVRLGHLGHVVLQRLDVERRRTRSVRFDPFEKANFGSQENHHTSFRLQRVQGLNHQNHAPHGQVNN